MLVRLLASAVIAALLLIGVGPSAPQSPAKLNAAPISATVSTAPKADPITPEQAQQIALEQAGLTAGQVAQLRTELDADEKVPHYDVEFRHGDWEYDYEISKTGQVLSADKEYDPVPTAPTQPEPTQPTPTMPTEPAPTEPTPTEPAPTQPAPVLLTAEEAKAIALTHAGLTKDQVTALRAEFDVDDGIQEWDVEFRNGDWEFDYSIHAETGAIRHNEKEFDPVAPAPTVPTEPAPTEPVPTEPAPTEPAPTQPAPVLLTAEEAKAIALTHAGLTKDQVTALRAEFDVDDGIQEWDVEFRNGDWEFDYSIHAETGAIRHNEKEFDPAAPAPTVPTEPAPTEPAPTEPVPTEPAPTQPKKLTAEEAKAIALEHAGLAKDQVQRLKAEPDREDGIPVFEVEFQQKGWEYEYTIHAETGAILEWDKEFDD